eukprot:scaffold26260_cov126-Isochrysis_galbana.AAC.1
MSTVRPSSAAVKGQKRRPGPCRGGGGSGRSSLVASTAEAADRCAGGARRAACPAAPSRRTTGRTAREKAAVGTPAPGATAQAAFARAPRGLAACAAVGSGGRAAVSARAGQPTPCCGRRRMSRVAPPGVVPSPLRVDCSKAVLHGLGERGVGDGGYSGARRVRVLEEGCQTVTQDIKERTRGVVKRCWGPYFIHTVVHLPTYYPGVDGLALPTVDSRCIPRAATAGIR